MNVISHSVGLLSQAVPRRLLVALAISFFAHYWIASNWIGGFRAWHPETTQISMHAQLAPLPPLLAAESEPVAVPPAEVEASPVKTTSMLPHVPVATIPADTGPQTSAAEEGFDARFYLARELDHYPVPLSALSLNEAILTGAVDPVRLWVSINQAGTVVDAVVIDAESSGASGQFARDMVLATRFSPARRDGRLVKSRVLLVLRSGS